MASNSYKWKYRDLGGMARVSIETGEDIAHLGELDQKVWTVLSCPVTGLEFDERTLSVLDSNKDGSIRVGEVVAAANYLTSVLTDKDLLVKETDVLPLGAINQKDERGVKLYKSARQILANLGLEKDSISLADASDSVAIFSKTRFNGDGVITAASADNEAQAATISKIADKTASVPDRSGEPGITAELIEKFYTACADYDAWVSESEKNASQIFPYGDNTAAALELADSLKDKMADYFLRCKLVKFDADAVSALDVSVERISAISANNLTSCTEEISSYPLARISDSQELPLDGINPAWQPAFDKLKALVPDIDSKSGEALKESEWTRILSKFDAYRAWQAGKKGVEVETLGTDEIRAILKANLKDELLELVARDKALEEEAGSIDAVNDFMHLYCHFYRFLKNYVTFADFYDRKTDRKAVFQAGVLFIDQRSCELCIRVSDMGKHGDMAGLSGMFLMYCDCVSRYTGRKMTIVAAMTDGDVNDIRVGKNALFYDRDGVDYDATVIKVIDNPISVRQAFWSPYRKFADWVSATINKFASDKESQVLSDAQSKTSEVKITDPADKTGDSKKQAFDIAKFAGVFAAIGMAFGFIGSALVSLGKGIAALLWWQLILVIAGIILLISGPSCFLAWGKLRRRNLAPVLNANGWAVNARSLVNIRFGATLTEIAKLPRLDLVDPEAIKRRAARSRTAWFIGTVLLLFAAICVYYFLACHSCSAI